MYVGAPPVTGGVHSAAFHAVYHGAHFAYTDSTIHLDLSI